MHKKYLSISQILENMAREKGMSVQTLRWHIELSMAQAQANPDPTVQAQWRRIPCSGKQPTVEEVLLYLQNASEQQME